MTSAYLSPVVSEIGDILSIIRAKLFTTARMRNVDGAMGVFTRSVLSIPSGKTLGKNGISFYW